MAAEQLTTSRLASWQIPPLDAERRIIAGVASGVARELGIDAIYVRVALVVLAVAGGWGALLYAAAWWFMTRRADTSAPYEPTEKGANPKRRYLGFALMMLGLVVLTAEIGSLFVPSLVWPIALVGTALALALDSTASLRLLSDERPNDQLRIVAGVVLLLTGMIAALALNFSFWQATRSIVVAGLVLGGAVVLFAPVLSRLGNELLEERRRRIRSDERADMAAHLHDSVLQTLALIQKRSSDVGVVNLARRQERELRSWLFNDRDDSAEMGFRVALERAIADVEDLHEVPIEVVVVGDRPVDTTLEPLLRAAREAAANAARHSGSARVDVFAEVRATAVDVFVRDQGIGFDPDAVDDDRAGIRDSIRGRMQRHGGSALIISRPGGGTEVELTMPIVAEVESDPVDV